ncbi:MAG: hypothetical protein BMS9Abin28_2179 [Anaerolineae bacterium]|nr:MAG: hypothetical protein BMS9Abin28_2179 [Anaerolineae bacterium]
MTRLIERVPVYVLWLALLPVVTLLASNLGQVRPTIGYRALALSALLALILLVLFRLILGDWSRAGLLTSLGLLLFFSYGHVYNALRSVELAGTTLGRHRFLLPAWMVLGAVGAWLIWKRAADAPGLTTALTLGLGAALLIPVVQIVTFQIGRNSAQAADLPALELQAGEPLPDIYYIVLDAYTSGSVLRDTYELDNEPFLARLRALGFYVADCSQSNYAQTELSMVSTLNMVYLSELIDESNPDRSQLWPLLRHNAVRLLLEDLGYETVGFETGYYWSEWEDADLYLAPDRGPLEGMSAFEATLLRSTAAWALIDALPELPAFLGRDLDRSADAHSARLLYVFEQLGQLTSGAGPKFVFAHIVSPHRPFVFDAQGNPTDDDYDWAPSDIGLDRYKAGYREQVQFLNGRMEQILGYIIENSAVPPIIVIQGDHGPEEGSGSDRMSILNAFYLGGAEPKESYPTITPVNTFRMVLGDRFDADLPLIEDASYFSSYNNPFDYSTVTTECFGETN